jgi:alpha-tubulin suppressor-like RCC1 family protein
MYRYSTSAPLEVLGKAHWLWGAPKFSKISAGDYHAALIGNDGKLYAIGLNTEGQVSHPDLECRVVGAYPVPLRSYFNLPLLIWRKKLLPRGGTPH